MCCIQAYIYTGRQRLRRTQKTTFLDGSKHFKKLHALHVIRPASQLELVLKLALYMDNRYGVGSD